MFSLFFKEERKNLEKTIKQCYKFFGLNCLTKKEENGYIQIGKIKHYYKNDDFEKVILKEVHEFVFPEVVLKRTKEELNLTNNELNLIIIDFFDYMNIVKYKRNNIDMLNKKTDVLWHNLILNTRIYLNFCINHIGFFVHHEPYMDEKIITKNEKIELFHLYTSTLRHVKNEKYAQFREQELRNNVLSTPLTHILVFSSLTEANTTFVREKVQERERIQNEIKESEEQKKLESDSTSNTSTTQGSVGDTSSNYVSKSSFDSSSCTSSSSSSSSSCCGGSASCG